MTTIKQFLISNLANFGVIIWIKSHARL